VNRAQRCVVSKGAPADVIAPPPGELFSETDDNSVAILLSYGTAHVLLAGGISDYWKPPICLRLLTPLFTPTHSNIIRLRPTRFDEDPPEIRFHKA
jgi:hypothetical protein